MPWVATTGLLVLLCAGSIQALEPASESAPEEETPPPTSERADEPEGDEAEEPIEIHVVLGKMLLRRPAARYPADAKRMGVEGTVRMRFLVDTDGSLVRRRDPKCPWSRLPKKERRKAFFDATWCAQVVEGPTALRAQTLDDWVTLARFRPMTNEDGEKTRYFATMDVIFKLR